MKAVVLAGGYATRLRPLTLTRPKPLLPILGKPLLLWILESLKKAGIHEVVISVRYMFQQIIDLLGDDGGLELDIVYVGEQVPLGDAGPLKLVDSKVGLDETFLVVYGDVLSDVDVGSVISFHRSKGALATLTAVPVENPERYGVLGLDPEGRVREFVEKPAFRQPSNLVNAGVYIFEPEVLRYIEDGRRQKISTDLMPRLLKMGRVYAYVHRGFWFDIGVPEDYLRANIVVLNSLYPNGYVDHTSEVRGDIVNPVYVGREVSIGRNSIIGPNTVILDQVAVGEHTVIRGSLVMRRSHIGSSTYVKNSIIGEECSVGSWVRIESGTIVGDQVSIVDEVFVNRYNRILPYKEIADSLWKEGEIVL